jgi:hypothetical protein
VETRKPGSGRIEKSAWVLGRKSTGLTPSPQSWGAVGGTCQPPPAILTHPRDGQRSATARTGQQDSGAFLPGLQVLAGDAPTAPVFALEGLKGISQARAVRGLRHGGIVGERGREGQTLREDELLMKRLDAAPLPLRLLLPLLLVHLKALDDGHHFVFLCVLFQPLPDRVVVGEARMRVKLAASSFDSRSDR